MSAPVDRVQVVTSNGTVVEIASGGRDAIVAQLHQADQEVGFELPIYRTLEAFEGAGASGPVQLGDRDDAAVVDAIRNLSERIGGEGRLEPGVARLYRTLESELRARWAEEAAQSADTADPTLFFLRPARESGPIARTTLGVGLSLAVGAGLFLLARRIKPDQPQEWVRLGQCARTSPKRTVVPGLLRQQVGEVVAGM